MRDNVIYVKGNEKEVRDASRAIKKILNKSPDDKRTHTSIQQQEEKDASCITTPKRLVKAKSQGQIEYCEAVDANDIIISIGPAGTGKTYLGVAKAVSYLIARKVERIILTRPAVEAGEALGFLPGDLAEKVDPYLRPLYDALHDMMRFEKAATLMQKGIIEVAPIADPKTPQD